MARSAGRGSPGYLPAVAHRRDLPLRAGGPQGLRGTRHLRPQRSQVAAGQHAGAALPPPAARGRRDQLRRDRETLRDPSRPGADAALRHHLAAAQGRHRLEQFQRRRRLHRPGRRRPRGPLAGAVGHGPRPHGNRDGHERPHRRPQLPAGRGRTPPPRDPPDRAQRHQQRPGPRRRRGRRRTAAGRFAAGQAGRGGGPPDPPRTRDAEPAGPRCPGPRSARRPRPARLARRGRSRRGHRPAAQGRPIAARPGRHPRPGQAAQRNPWPPAAGREDRALLRPHRPDRASPPAPFGKTCWPAWAWSRWCCCCSSATSAPR